MNTYFELVKHAQQRLLEHLVPTPLISSQTINATIPGGHSLYFKAEMLQKTGAFKARGALNTMLWAEESGLLTPDVVAVSSGNHGQAVAWAAAKLGVSAHVFMAKTCSPIKIKATRAYGANVVLAEDRSAAEHLATELVQQKKSLFIPPYDHDQVIAGQATACTEAWTQGGPYDAIFAPCGGGGLLSGTIVATRMKSPICKIYGAEPDTANDAAISLRQNKIHRFAVAPQTICDGVRTLGLSPRTFAIMREHLSGIFEISDREAVAWAKVLMHYLKVQTEPTSALAMAAAVHWLKQQSTPQNCLIILSGGNMDAHTLREIYAVEDEDTLLC